MTRLLSHTLLTSIATIAAFVILLNDRVCAQSVPEGLHDNTRPTFDSQEELRSASHFLKQRDFERAIKSYTHILVRSPMDDNALFGHGLSLLYSKRPKEAFESFRQLSNVGKYAREKAFYCGLAQLNAGNRSSALEFFNDRLSDDAGHALTNYYIALIYYKEREYSKSADQIRSLLDCNNAQRGAYVSDRRWPKKPNDLTQESVKQLCLDRPEVGVILESNRVIRRTIVDAFGGELNGFRIRWSGDLPVRGADSDHDYSTSGKFATIRVVRNGDGWESIASLVFECENVRSTMKFQELRHRAALGSISKDEFVREIAQKEYEACLRVRCYYFDKLYKPESVTQADFIRWKLLTEPSFDMWLESFGTGDIYPWRFYGRVYDHLSEGSPALQRRGRATRGVEGK